MKIMSLIRRFRAFLSDLCWWNRCPYCDESFCVSGAGDLIVDSHHDPESGRWRLEVVSFCYRCLTPGRMDSETLRVRLERWGYPDETIRKTVEAVGNLNAGRSMFDIDMSG
jgi:hypothetical protein